MRRLLDRPRGRRGVLVGVAVVVFVLCTPLLGRADVTGNYRPLLPPEALSTGCYPLPGGVVPDFEYVVRRDADTLTADGVRRRLLLHYDRIGAAEAERTLRDQLERAGVGGDVRISAHDFEGVPDDAVVRGEMLLDLPVVERQSDDPVCSDPAATKRFTPDLPDDS